MKKFLSTYYSAGAFNIAMLILRVGVAGLMMVHGYDKLKDFEGTASHMMSFMGLGAKASTALLIFAEFFCSLMVIIGLFTRLACIPLIIAMGVALFKAHNGQITGDGQMAGLFLIVFVALLFTGAGKVSVDAMVSK